MRFIIFMFCLLSILVCKAAHSYEAPCYFGIDSQYTKAPFQLCYGKNFIPKGAAGVNPFIGVNINEYIALELGYQRSMAIRTATIESGGWVAGFQLPTAISPITLKTSIKLEGPHVNLLLNSPFFINNRFQIFAGGGLSQIRATVIRKTIQYNMYVGRATRILENTRSIRRLTIGMNYFLIPELAVRFSTTLLKYDRFHQFTCDDYYPYIRQEIRAKNGVSYSLGLRWNF